MGWSGDVDVGALFFTAGDRPLVWGHRYENQIQNGAAEQNYQTPDAKHPIGPTFSHEQESKTNERDGYEIPTRRRHYSTARLLATSTQIEQ